MGNYEGQLTASLSQQRTPEPTPNSTHYHIKWIFAIDDFSQWPNNGQPLGRLVFLKAPPA
jgi:hypothetical protein